MGDINKVKIVVKLINATVHEQISTEDFFRLESMLERIPFVDLKELKHYSEEHMEEGALTDVLYAAGALHLTVIDAEEQNRYTLSDLGRKL